MRADIHQELEIYAFFKSKTTIFLKLGSLIAVEFRQNDPSNFMLF